MLTLSSLRKRGSSTWNHQSGSSKQAKRRQVPKLPILSMERWLLQDVLDCEVYMAWKGDLTNTCRKDTLVTIKYRNTTSDWKRSWTLKVFLHMKYHFTCSLFMLPPTNICNWLLGAALYHYNSIWSKYSEILYYNAGSV